VSTIDLSETQQASRRENLSPHLALLCVQLLFGTWPIVGKFILRVIPSSGLATLRVVGAALAFLLLRRLRGARSIESRKDYAWLLLFSLLAVVLNQLFFLKGLSLTTVINATILSATIPVFALIVGVLIGNDNLSILKVLGVLFAASGVIYLVNPARAEFSGSHLIGDLLLVLNSFSYGCYIAISKNIIKRYGTVTVVSWLFILGALLIAPFGISSLDSTTLVQTTPKIWLAIFYVIMFPTVLTYLLNAWALARVAPSVVAVYIYLQPLIGFCLAPYFLGEKWNSRAWVAMALIFTGVFYVTRQKKEADVHTTLP
jgi:drug/metabolite transporter (DMT)-like permease